MVNALRAVGFDYVMDTDFTADLTIMEEANELLSRLRGERPHAKLPLFTSCCKFQYLSLPFMRSSLVDI